MQFMKDDIISFIKEKSNKNIFFRIITRFYLVKKKKKTKKFILNRMLTRSINS